MKGKGFSISTFVSQNNQIKQISIDLLDYNDDYERYEGERYEDMVESIRQNGIIQPLLVRAMPNDRFTILAGNNRRYCGEAAGLISFPCIVKDNITDEEAQMYIDETNIYQRGFASLKISKQAEVVSRRYSQMFNEQKRMDIQREIAMLNGQTPPEQTDTSPNKMTKVGREYDLSKNTVARLIRIDKLLPALKPLVDDKIVKIRAGVELSYMPEEQQEVVANVILKYKLPTLDIKTGEALRKLSAEGKLDDEIIEKIIIGEIVPVTEPVVPKSEDETSVEPEQQDTTEDASDQAYNDDTSESSPEDGDGDNEYTEDGDEENSVEDDSERDGYEVHAANSSGTQQSEFEVEIKLKPSTIKKYFSPSDTPATIQKTIEAALKLYFETKHS